MENNENSNRKNEITSLIITMLLISNLLLTALLILNLPFLIIIIAAIIAFIFRKKIKKSYNYYIKNWLNSL